MNVWEYFSELFDYFPIACIIDNEYICLHGGISPSIETVEEI